MGRLLSWLLSVLLWPFRGGHWIPGVVGVGVALILLLAQRMEQEFVRRFLAGLLSGDKDAVRIVFDALWLLGSIPLIWQVVKAIVRLTPLWQAAFVSWTVWPAVKDRAFAGVLSAIAVFFGCQWVLSEVRFYLFLQGGLELLIALLAPQDPTGAINVGIVAAMPVALSLAVKQLMAICLTDYRRRLSATSAT